jgi:cytochrome P450
LDSNSTEVIFLQLIWTTGAEWKKARRLFNPGFSIGHLSTLIPGIVNDTLVFRETLGKYADSGEVFQIEKEVAGLTVDIIGHIVLDHDMLAQTTNNEFVRYFRSAVHWSPSASNINPLINYNPILPIMMWYNTRRMDAYLMKVLDDRFSSRAHLAHNSTTRGKPAIDLALDEYTAEQTALGNSTGRVTDMAFKRFAIDQMKTFIFAGHDTTSSTVAYIYYLLHYHPEALAKLRKEFDDVFGDDIGATADLIKTKPLLINKLVYSTAVIKGEFSNLENHIFEAQSQLETLRLYPPASSVRQGDGAIKLDGHEYPAKGFMVWVVSHSIHRRPELFPSPDKFIPERFLPAPDNWQEVPKDAWRPFEKGPRACIGQELAMLETKIIMALTLRDFDIRGAFEEWDAKLGRKKPGDMLDGQRGMFGYRSYQVLSGSAKPVDSMPSVVKRRVFT